jgi:hypothetical protein
VADAKTGKTGTILGMLGLIIAAIGAYFAYQQFLDKRPVLDITSAVITQRLKGDDEYGIELDDLKITIKNRGAHEASDVMLPTAFTDNLIAAGKDDKDKDIMTSGRRRTEVQDIPATEEITVEKVETFAEKGDFQQHVKFHFKPTYLDRNNGKAYSDRTFCFWTSQFHITKDIPADPADKVYPIQLHACRDYD